ncbi:MAG: helix-turn-helix domain-containing protein [Actinobacteria bacterium]|nr:helix-turn-helix domain-containing protein [Actinomycetota bacterium]
MDLEHDRCYRAVRSRDRRFDGRFFTAVTTTGIFCRPVCPARTPRRENVTFFRTAAAAEGAGFRPCRRCRPEAAPGSAAWDEPSALVGRALRLIDDGALDESNGEGLAGRLGISERQLRRLFGAQLGTTPSAIARSRRGHLARRLLDDTDLPISTIAFASGFRSLRQFNEVMRAIFKCTPSELRGRETPVSPTAPVRLRLSFRPPFDWGALGDFLGERAIPGVESWDGDRYQRAVDLGETTGVIDVEHDGARSELIALLRSEQLPPLLSVSSRLRAMFDLDSDPAAVLQVLSDDEGLRRLVERRPGLRVPGVWDPFEAVVRAIIGQQISVDAARSVVTRVAHSYGRPLRGFENVGPSRTFPGAEQLASAPLEDAGATARGADAIRTLAKMHLDGELVQASARGADHLTDVLAGVRGVGPWTAAYIGLRGFGEPDAFPAADLGLRKGAARLFGEIPSAGELGRRAERWRPWRSYAALQLWTGPNQEKEESWS